MKSLDDMTEPELRDTMQDLAVSVKNRLPAHTGFIVLAAPFGQGVAQYVSNVQRSCCVEWMLEALLRWQRNDFIEQDEPPEPKPNMKE